MRYGKVARGSRGGLEGFQEGLRGPPGGSGEVSGQGSERSTWGFGEGSEGIQKRVEEVPVVLGEALGVWGGV